MKKFVVFDMDGTLMDTIYPLTKATNLGLKELGYPYEYSIEEVKTFIGRGARHLFTCALKKEATDEEMDVFKKIYEKTQYESKPFPGCIETLKDLNKKNIKILIYSNKPNEILQKLVENKFKGIDLLHVQGEDKNYPPKPDVSLLSKILNELNLEPKDGIYVGDSIVDLLTAKNIKMDSAIYSFGYGDKKEILDNKPDYYLDNFKDLEEIL